MNATFIELPAFERHREAYLGDKELRLLQLKLLTNPVAGDVLKGTGGLRKVRFQKKQSDKGKRSGIRVIYYWWEAGREFWLFTLYGKGEMSDLTQKQYSMLRDLLEKELSMRC